MSIVNSNNFLHKTVDGVKQFFSPLVNAATVVLKDGTRLEKDGRIHADTADDSEKLGGKAPEAYAQTEDVLTYEEIQASTDLTGKLPSAQALMDGDGKFGKIIWQGNFTSGTISVPEINNYRTLIFRSNAVCMIGTQAYGGGGYLKYGATTNVTATYRYSNIVDGQLSVTAECKGVYDSTGAQLPLTAIIGLC